jgi:flavin reductase
MHSVTRSATYSPNANDREPSLSEGLRDAYVDAMATAATGVTVVTAATGETLFGQTVSAMCSVSADPPMLLVCVNRRSPVVAAITESRRFCVSVLSTRHAHVADTFAGRPSRGAPWDFGCAEWATSDVGVPRLRDAVASFACGLDGAHRLGSHVVFFGLVKEALRRDGAPLVYSGRAYGRPAALAAASSQFRQPDQETG